MKKILRRLGLTAKETAFIAFLLITFIAGLIIKYSGWNRPDKFSYSESDKQFEEKTKRSFESLRHQSLDSLQKERSDEIKKIADSLGNDIENRTNKKDVKIDKAININNAFAADLMLLPGIGEVIADRIIDYREKINGFKKIEDIKKVKGIGEKKFEKIKEFITVE